MRKLHALLKLMSAWPLPISGDDQEAAQSLIAEMQRFNAVIKPIGELVTGSGDLEVLIEFAEMEDEPGASSEETGTDGQ